MSSNRRRGALTALAITAAAGLTLTALPNGVAASAPPSASGGDTPSPVTHAPKERMGNYDARTGSPKAELRQARKVVGSRGKSFNAFTKGLGRQAIVDYDPATGTPRNLTKLNGYLTDPSSASAKSVAMDYVRAHLHNLGLVKADLGTFHLRRDYVDVAGIHHISWTQHVDGITVFGNGLKANVTKDGRLLSIQGSPVSGLTTLAKHATTKPRLSAAAARAKAADDVDGKAAPVAVTKSSTAHHTTWKNNDSAQLVWFKTSSGLQLGWSTYVQAGGNQLNYQHVIDATTGRVLYRHDNVNFENDPSREAQSKKQRRRHRNGDALVYRNYPGAKRGGKAHVVNLYKAGFLPRHQKSWLKGKYVIAWSDLNDNDLADSWEKTPIPGNRHRAQWRLHPFQSSGLCSKHYVCTWDPDQKFSWRRNRRADVTQAFFFDSLYHNYLQKAPIGFTPQAGNFELRGGDPVLLNALDGANTNNGLPDGNHIDNANMATPPDGIPGTMQMYLWHFPGTTDEQDPFVPTSGAFAPSVIFHEYTHGLSNRLVVDSQGNSTLNSIQAGAMGEAWSDYYAMDYLVSKGYVKDNKRSGQVFEGSYLMADKAPFRTMAIDCAVGARAKGCTGISGNRGGYTYGEFPTIGGSPEVHSSGEVWAQTLWDLRKRLGHKRADMIITRAMELSPSDPSMLDMRNAILQANLAVYGGAKSKRIWHVFANRGMGWYAGALNAGDAYPVEDFHMPPSPETPRATVSGQVVNPITDKPVANALVSIGGHDSGYTGNYTAVTNASGHYVISNVYVGNYPLVTVFGPGYEVLTKSVSVVRGGTTANFSPRRDWAASTGGGQVTDFNGPDYSAYGCGPAGAIDLSQGTGWGSNTGDIAGDPTNTMIPKYVVVKLPKKVTLSGFAVNPSNTCGDPGSSSTGDYKIETSSDGTTWSTAKEGTFTEGDRQLTEVPIDSPVPDVQYVKFWILSPQVPDFSTTCPEGNYGGCTFTDMTELEVFGK